MFADGPYAFTKCNYLILHFVKNSNSDRLEWRVANEHNKNLEGEYTYITDLYKYSIDPLSFSNFIHSITSYMPKKELSEEAKNTVNKFFDFYIK